MEIWPCNVKTFRLFNAMSTQWRVGMGGAAGLDYAVLPRVARWCSVRLTRQRFRDVATMEGEALRVMSARSNAA